MMFLGCALSMLSMAQPCEFEFEYVGKAVEFSHGICPDCAKKL